MRDLEDYEFLAKRRLSGIKIFSEPWFGSSDATDWFLEAIRSSARYLEYGTGGSTYTAAKTGVEFVAIDSDRDFLDAVRKKIADDGFANPATQTYLHADIGKTGSRGRPLHWNKADAARLDQFRRYSDLPAACFDGGITPDLVLVDGRFRVACALKALRMLRGRQGWTLAVDDYVPRRQYHVIADFAEVDEYIADRIAVFRSTKEFSTDKIDARIREFETDPA
ncbi:hypothetical protein [Mycolicibacterium frederiksbergense]|uniref:hypothetical protein n=1 Tax=Mycolicibacterium frederiksbergense TaxID=117567 RepID=UPI00399AE47F